MVRIYCFRCHKIQDHTLIGDDYQCLECGSLRSTLFKLQPEFREYLEKQWEILEKLDRAVEKIKEESVREAVRYALRHPPWEKET